MKTKFKPLEKGITKEIIEQTWEAFHAILNKSIEDLQTAGDLVVKLLDNDPDARPKFKALGLSLHTISRLERIGRGRLLPELATKTAFFDHLPLKDQKRVARNKVPAVITKPDGTHEVKQVNLLEQDSTVQNRVAGDRGLRTIDEQMEYIKRAAKPRPTETAEKWRINTKLGKVIFLANSAYDPEQLRDILGKLEEAIANRKAGPRADQRP